jgi:hypothetical protein
VSAHDECRHHSDKSGRIERFSNVIRRCPALPTVAKKAMASTLGDTKYEGDDSGRKSRPQKKVESPQGTLYDVSYALVQTTTRQPRR